MADAKEMFRALLAERGGSISDHQLDQFETYFRLLVDWNERMNLTGITEREQVYLKHFFDSVSMSFFIPIHDVRTIADIGSGAGFPSVPLKILYPHLTVTIVDSLQKRIGFLQNLVNELGLEQVTCLHARAEDAGRLAKHRDAYDVVTARAVARMNVLSEFCLPFVRPQGVFVAMKGTDPTEELKESVFAWKELGGKLEANHPFELPLEQSHRHIIVVRKTKPTPSKYPRKTGVPLKLPLMKS